MSKPRPWLPNAGPILTERPPFNADEAAWRRIEAALGKSLAPSDRDKLAEIGRQYMALRVEELNPPLASDAVAYIDAIEEAARAMNDALRPLLEEPRAAQRVRKLFDYALRDMHFRSGAPAGLAALYFIGPVPDLLIGAAGRVRQRLDAVGTLGDEVKRTAPTFAWDWLIGELKEFVESRGVKASARKDADKAAGKNSIFPVFVKEFQLAFPAELRRGAQSTEALSKLISEALKKSRNGTDSGG